MKNDKSKRDNKEQQSESIETLRKKLHDLMQDNCLKILADLERNEERKSLDQENDDDAFQEITTNKEIMENVFHSLIEWIEEFGNQVHFEIEECRDLMGINLKLKRVAQCSD